MIDNKSLLHISLFNNEHLIKIKAYSAKRMRPLCRNNYGTAPKRRGLFGFLDSQKNTHMQPQPKGRGFFLGLKYNLC